jgi:hypothetical protein
MQWLARCGGLAPVKARRYNGGKKQKAGRAVQGARWREIAKDVRRAQPRKRLGRKMRAYCALAGNCCFYS